VTSPETKGTLGSAKLTVLTMMSRDNQAATSPSTSISSAKPLAGTFFLEPEIGAASVEAGCEVVVVEAGCEVVVWMSSAEDPFVADEVLLEVGTRIEVSTKASTV
jgi:hypothetical protein